jgi:hypothetical protein
MHLPSSQNLQNVAISLNADIKQARAAGDIPAMLAAAANAIATLEAALAAAPEASAEDRSKILKTAQRIAYNVAADVYPGWEINTPARTGAELLAAQNLARQAQDFVEQTGGNPIQRGNATWLIAALDLALGQRTQAAAGFRAAATQFSSAPEMQLMAQGYALIAEGAVGRDDVLIALTAIGSEDALELHSQLTTAAQIFGASPQNPL